MSKKLSTLLFFLIIVYNLGVGQTISPIQALYKYPASVATISWDGNKYLTPDNQFEKFPQCLIRNNKGLFVALNGSGRLYKAVNQDNQIAFQRIDSTVYFGSNFGSFIFSYHDTIFSLGGYGFWKTNGLLRYFVEQRHEWEIIKLNREVPLLTGNNYDLIWFDQAKGKIYFGFTKEENNNTKDREPKNNLRFESLVLDLSKKEWQQTGLLSTFLKNELTNIVNISSSPFGQMIAFRNKNLFLDYTNNKIYRLSDTKQSQLEQLPTSTGDTHVNYFIDSTFYSWLRSKNLVDSLQINKKDLVLLNEKIYSEKQNSYAETASAYTNQYVVLFIIVLIVISVAAYFSVKKKETKPSVIEKKENNFISPFTPLEKNMIRVILFNSIDGRFTSIDEINNVLGVSKKNIEIQKKQRSDVITSVNSKYSYLKRSKIELIEKRRTEYDKRSFEYFIDHSRINEVQDFVIQPKET